MSPNKCPVKAGFYKIISTLDGSVLTVTDEGRPSRGVITEPWADKETQQWKVKFRGKEGITIIRSEVVHENDVSKELDANQKDFVPVDWNFTPAADGKANTFLLQNKVGALTNNGSGQRISFGTADGSAANQLWEFEFLSEIPSKE